MQYFAQIPANRIGHHQQARCWVIFLNYLNYLDQSSNIVNHRSNIFFYDFVIRFFEKNLDSILDKIQQFAQII